MKMTVNTSRFGQIECSPEDLVSFSDGLIGFGGRQRFVMIEHKPGSPFRWMQSVDDGGLAFLLVDPAEYKGDYAPMMPKRAAHNLKMVEDTPRLVYTIVTIPQGRPEDMTLNLAAPIVINGDNGEAMQVILEDAEYPVRWRVFAEGTRLSAAAA